MNFKPQESDWKIFRRRVPQWRERYLERKNKEIVYALTNANRTPTEQFWDAERKISRQAKILVKCLDGHSRSKMLMYLMTMYGHGLIEESDLDVFSEELRDRILAFGHES